MSGELELFSPAPDDGLDARMRHAVQADALETIVRRAKSHTRTALHDALTETSGEGGITKRLHGWSAVITDPQPRPKVVDPEAFAEWVVGKGGTVHERERVEVVDHATVVKQLRQSLEYGLDPVTMQAALKVVVEPVLPEDPFDAYGRWFYVTPAGVVDVETGEIVPGTTVEQGQPTLQLRPGKGKRDEAVREVARVLGIPPELTEGDT